MKILKNLLDRRKIWKFNRLIFVLFFYFKQSLNISKPLRSEKIVFFNRKDWVFFQRYTYILAKYFLNEGYQVYFPKNFKQMYHFSTELDCNFLFKEKQVFFRIPPKGLVPTVEFDEKNIGPDYFKNTCLENKDLSELHIPIGFHPFHYYMSYLPGHLNLEMQRINKVFFAGNFNSEFYSHPFLTDIFKILNRMELFSFLQGKNLVEVPQTIEELFSILTEENQNAKDIIIVLGKSVCSIHPSEIKAVVEKFQFFLAFPGMYMPLCHNLTEAMSVGTIPILQENYAKVMNPPLIHLKNCISFSGTEDLEQVIAHSLGLADEEKNRIRINVREYFDRNLSSKAIVSKIESGQFYKYLLMAEQKSVELVVKPQSKEV